MVFFFIKLIFSLINMKTETSFSQLVSPNFQSKKLIPVHDSISWYQIPYKRQLRSHVHVKVSVIKRWFTDSTAINYSSPKKNKIKRTELPGLQTKQDLHHKFPGRDLLKKCSTSHGPVPTPFFRHFEYNWTSVTSLFSHPCSQQPVVDGKIYGQMTKNDNKLCTRVVIFPTRGVAFWWK